ncbi:MAG: hypothetical protein IJS78_06620 [Clostridia bacterium]|nr:hypothetical protein [Clostridia bacterium]
MTEKKRTERYLAAVSYAADMRAKQIREDAERKAEERRLSDLESARLAAAKRSEEDVAAARRRAAARLSSAEREAREAVTRARGEETDRITERAAESLREFAKSAGYRDYMTEIARRIAAALDGEEDARIFISPRDAALADEMSEAAGGVPVLTDEKIALGGAYGDSHGVTCDCTLETALGEKRASVIAALSEAGGETT